METELYLFEIIRRYSELSQLKSNLNISNIDINKIREYQEVKILKFNIDPVKIETFSGFKKNYLIKLHNIVKKIFSSENKFLLECFRIWQLSAMNKRVNRVFERIEKSMRNLISNVNIQEASLTLKISKSNKSESNEKYFEILQLVKDQEMKKNEFMQLVQFKSYYEMNLLYFNAKKTTNQMSQRVSRRISKKDKIILDIANQLKLEDKTEMDDLLKLDLDEDDLGNGFLKIYKKQLDKETTRDEDILDDEQRRYLILNRNTDGMTNFSWHHKLTVKLKNRGSLNELIQPNKFNFNIDLSELNIQNFFMNKKNKLKSTNSIPEIDFTEEMHNNNLNENNKLKRIITRFKTTKNILNETKFQGKSNKFEIFRKLRSEFQRDLNSREMNKLNESRKSISHRNLFSFKNENINFTSNPKINILTKNNEKDSEEEMPRKRKTIFASKRKNGSFIYNQLIAQRKMDKLYSSTDSKNIINPINTENSQTNQEFNNSYQNKNLYDYDDNERNNFEILDKIKKELFNSRISNHKLLIKNSNFKFEINEENSAESSEGSQKSSLQQDETRVEPRKVTILDSQIIELNNNTNLNEEFKVTNLNIKDFLQEDKNYETLKSKNNKIEHINKYSIPNFQKINSDKKSSPIFHNDSKNFKEKDSELHLSKPNNLIKSLNILIEDQSIKNYERPTKSRQSNSNFKLDEISLGPSFYNVKTTTPKSNFHKMIKTMKEIPLTDRNTGNADKKIMMKKNSFNYTSKTESRNNKSSLILEFSKDLRKPIKAFNYTESKKPIDSDRNYIKTKKKSSGIGKSERSVSKKNEFNSKQNSYNEKKINKKNDFNKSANNKSRNKMSIFANKLTANSFNKFHVTHNTKSNKKNDFQINQNRSQESFNYFSKKDSKTKSHGKVSLVKTPKKILDQNISNKNSNSLFKINKRNSLNLKKSFSFKSSDLTLTPRASGQKFLERSKSEKRQCSHSPIQKRSIEFQSKVRTRTKKPASFSISEGYQNMNSFIKKGGENLLQRKTRLQKNNSAVFDSPKNLFHHKRLSLFNSISRQRTSIFNTNIVKEEKESDESNSSFEKNYVKKKKWKKPMIENYDWDVAPRYLDFYFFKDKKYINYPNKAKTKKMQPTPFKFK